MIVITFDHPAPSCLVPITHPAYAYVHSTHQTPERLAATFKMFEPIRVCAIDQKNRLHLAGN